MLTLDSFSKNSFACIYKIIIIVANDSDSNLSRVIDWAYLGSVLRINFHFYTLALTLTSTFDAIS